jgi:hypothetical protein
LSSCFDAYELNLRGDLIEITAILQPGAPDQPRSIVVAIPLPFSLTLPPL